jgi:hypothetical protein
MVINVPLQHITSIYNFFSPFNMANSASLPPKLQAQLDEARAKIPIDRRRVPSYNSVVSHPNTAFTHINNWAFLNGYAYVRASGSTSLYRVRYKCILYLRKNGKRTQNTLKLDEKDRQRVATKVQEISCPIGITVTRFVRNIRELGKDYF